MTRTVSRFFFILCTVPLIIWGNLLLAQEEATPLEILQKQELKNRDSKGEVYLGKVMTILYPPGGVEADEKYYPLLLELTDVLKTPLRKNYRVVLKGYSDNIGSSLENMRLSVKRAERLKALFEKRYYFGGGRITTKGLGETDPVASNETEEGRSLNRRVEVHVYGDVSEAVRFIDKQEE